MIRALISLALMIPIVPISAATVELEPAAPVVGMDPQGVLSGFSPRLPIGGMALLRVVGGDREIELSNEDTDVIALDETLGGGPEVLVTADLILDHLLDFDDLSDNELDAADLNFDGMVDIADLVYLLPFPSQEWYTGGDAIALIAAMPDGAGPLDESGVIGSQTPRIVLANDQFIDSIDAMLVDNLMSLVPSSLAVRPGESFSIAMQIDSAVGFSQTLGYTARITWAAQAVEQGTVSGASDNGDFDGRPNFDFSGNSVAVDELLDSRSDTGEAVINVLNIPFVMSESAQPGTLIPFLLDSSACSIQPQTGGPIIPPNLKVLGCAVRVAR